MDTMNSKSVRRPSALGASELRRMAAQAAQFSAPSPLGQDDSLRTRSTDFGPGSLRARCACRPGSVEQPLLQVPLFYLRCRQTCSFNQPAVRLDTSACRAEALN